MDRIKMFITSSLFVLMFSSITLAHVESGFTRVYTVDGYQVIYSWEPVRPKIGDTVTFRMDVKYWDVQEDVPYSVIDGSDASQIKPGDPVAGLGGFVDVSKGYSQFVEQSKIAMEQYQIGRFFMKEVSPGNFEASYVFDKTGSYKIRFLLTDADNYFQIDNHEQNLQIEPKSPGLLFTGYSVLFVGMAIIFSKMNEINIRKLRGGKSENVEKES